MVLISTHIIFTHTLREEERAQPFKIPRETRANEFNDLNFIANEGSNVEWV